MNDINPAQNAEFVRISGESLRTLVSFANACYCTPAGEGDIDSALDEAEALLKPPPKESSLTMHDLRSRYDC